MLGFYLFLHYLDMYPAIYMKKKSSKREEGREISRKDCVFIF